VAQAVLHVIEVEEAPPPVVDLAISKEVVPEAALPARAITYTLRYWNAGDLVAQGVVINEAIPPEIMVTGLRLLGRAHYAVGGRRDFGLAGRGPGAAVREESSP